MGAVLAKTSLAIACVFAAIAAFTAAASGLSITAVVCSLAATTITILLVIIERTQHGNALQ